MKYECGTEVMLGDEIMVGHGPDKETLARVVAIGTDQAVDWIDREYYVWAKEERIIDKDTIVIEWISTNPLAHEDPQLAPVGNYMTIHCLCCETFVRRGQPK